jgi:hypothetical protein
VFSQTIAPSFFDEGNLDADSALEIPYATGLRIRGIYNKKCIFSKIK